MRGWLLRLLMCMALPVTYTLAAPLAPDPIEVVVSPTVTEHIISRNALRAMFGMRLRTWSNGAAVWVYVLNDNNPNHIAFCKQILGIFPHQLRVAWDRLVFSGTGQAPVEVASEEELRARVATTPGAIGYLRRSMVNDSVRVLQIR